MPVQRTHRIAAPILWCVVAAMVIASRNDPIAGVAAFASTSSTSFQPLRQHQQQLQRCRNDDQGVDNLRMAATTSSSSSKFKVPLPALPNPMKRLPWNVKKEQERMIYRRKIERAKLHRQLGIAEDATYEEIVIATDRLIALAGTDLKAKIQVEVAKDKILQHRLNERLAGLQAESKEARAMSTYEVEGADDDLSDEVTKAMKEWSAPAWTQGLVVKPNRDHVMSQLRLWGIITTLGAALPPVQDYLGRFTWLICVAQLTFRGMPKQDQDMGGMGMNFGAARGGGHRKVAFALGVSTWIVGAIIAYGLMPSWARGQRWTNTMAFAIQNLIFGLVSCYLQPYKGK